MSLGATRKSRTTGFSLIELILATLIVAIIAAFGLYSLVSGHESAQSRGMAEEIAEELKAARQQAVSKGIPVALAFPSGNGSTGRSQAFYQLEGNARPRLTRSMTYKDAYPDSCFFWGPWGTSTPDSTAPSPTDAQFNLATWTPIPNASDPLIVFTPSGSVKSNGLPVFDGEYRLLVSNGVEAGGAGSAPTAVSKPYTVSISKVGSVSVTPGVIGGVGIPVRPSVALGAVASTIPSTPPLAGGPVIRPLKSEPTPKERSEGGALTAIPREGFITVIAEADDATGLPLTIRWEASGGKFSSQESVPMVWDPVARVWTGRAVWTPPSPATTGDIFQLSCFVSNADGQVAQRQLDASRAVELVQGDRIAAISQDGTDVDPYLAWLNPEGNSVQNVTNSKPINGSMQETGLSKPVWSPNGEKIAYIADRRLDPNGEFNLLGSSEKFLYLANRDGTDLKKLYRTDGDFQDFKGPSFSPNGARIAFSAYTGGGEDDLFTTRIRVADAFGTGRPTFTLTGGPGDPVNTWSVHTDAVWHPTDNWVIYTADVVYKDGEDIRSSSIRVCDVSNLGAGPPPSNFIVKVHDDAAVTDEDRGLEAGDDVGQATWSHDGSKICYVKGANEFDTSSKLFVIGFNKTTGLAKKANGSDLTGYGSVGSPNTVPPEGLYPGRDITPAGVGGAGSPRYSPKDDKIAFFDKTEDGLWVVNAGGGGARKLTSAPVIGFNWSPRGDELIYWRDDDQLILISAITGEQKNITPANFTLDATPAWWIPAP